MKFRTELIVNKSPLSIDHSSKILMLGSCFTDNIGQLLRRYRFDTLVNPFGISYNPLSILELLDRAIDNRLWTEDDLVKNGGVWRCFDLHSDFSNPDKSALLKSMNEELQKFWSFISRTDVMIISPGTSRVYEHMERDIIVNNCHKFLASDFTNRFVWPKEFFNKFEEVHNKLLYFNPGLEVVFTISPVRHIKDGLIQNNQSKSLLNVAIRWICEEKEGCHYFPAYELLIDDLRDYRFYESDLVHPNKMAIEYIWNNFREFVFEEKTKSLIEEIEKLLKAKEHRAFHPESEEHLKFEQKLNSRILEFEEKNEEIRIL